MEDLTTKIRRLRRPELLVTAARQMQSTYSRHRDLGRILGRTPGRGPALVALLDIEAEMEAARVDRARQYSAARHVRLLGALMAEAATANAASEDRVS